LKKRKLVRAVIDTNLFVSGLFAQKGYTYMIQELWMSGAFELGVSEKILMEVVNTLKNPKSSNAWDCRIEKNPLFPSLSEKKRLS
jgi:predicted nucleic acid-binding protein